MSILLLFSCSKEQPLMPIDRSAKVESSQMTGNTGVIVVSDDSVDEANNESGDADITDPEDEDKEKTNKKAKI